MFILFYKYCFTDIVLSNNSLSKDKDKWEKKYEDLKIEKTKYERVNI